MAKVIVAWCDPCMAHDEQTPGHPFQIALNGSKPIEIDLCNSHEKEFITPLRELLGEAGQPISGVASPEAEAAGKRPCPECARSLSREGMRKHMMTMHGMDRMGAGDVVREQFGNRYSERTVTERKCPECDESFDTPQGLGAHRRSVHNVKGANSKPAKKAASSSDPTLDIPEADAPAKRKARKTSASA